MTGSKECSANVGRFTKHEDAAYGEGYVSGWNDRGEMEPHDIRRESCVTCEWYAGHGQCAKRQHRACPDWEPMGD